MPVQLVLAVAAALLVAEAVSAAPGRPHIVVILADDLVSSELGQQLRNGADPPKCFMQSGADRHRKCCSRH